MTRIMKTHPLASFKALPGEGEGTFEAIVSVFGNVDLQGDRVMPGAFTKSIAKWQKTGDPVPVLWSHDWGDPFAHIGYVDPKDMKEVAGNQKAGIPGGLYVKGHLDVHKPFAKQVYDLLAERRVTEHSFSYDIPIGGERRGKDGANELIELDIIELGPTLKGANPRTITMGTKSADDLKFRLERAADLGHKAEFGDGQKRSDSDPVADAELKTMLAKAGWNGDAAMKACKSAADFRKIAFERDNDSDPDTAAHWALPHHSSPGGEADPGGVSAALAALNGARGGAPDLKNTAAAMKHLEAHRGSEKAGAKHLPGQHDQLDHAGGGGGSSPKVGDRVAQPGGGTHTYVVDQQRGDESHLMHDTGISAGWHRTEDLQVVDEQGEHITPSGARSSGTPEQEAEASAIIEQLLDSGILDEETLEEASDPLWGSHDTLQELISADLVPEEEVERIRELLRGISDPFDLGKTRGKAGRAIGSRVAARLRERIMEAIDEVLEEVNGSGDGLEENDLEEIEEEKAFTTGYADAASGRQKSGSSGEYVRGYEAGIGDRKKVEHQEITKLEGQLASLEIRK